VTIGQQLRDSIMILSHSGHAHSPDRLFLSRKRLASALVHKMHVQFQGKENPEQPYKRGFELLGAFLRSWMNQFSGSHYLYDKR